MKKLYILIPYLGYFLGILLISSFLAYSFNVLSPYVAKIFTDVPKEITAYQTGYIFNEEKTDAIGETFYWEVKGIDGRDIKFIKIFDANDHFEKEVFDMRENKDESGEIIYYGMMENPILTMVYNDEDSLLVDSIEI